METNIKFEKSWNFKTFLYKNYGFSVTREQDRKANVLYLKLISQS